MLPTPWSRRATRRHAAPRSQGRTSRLQLEPLEDRSLLSFTAGPLALISHPDPLGGIPGVLGTDVAAEPYVAVNPTNSNNMAAIWMDQYPNANAVSVTLDGGTTWQNVAIPGFTTLTGGTGRSAFDPWLSFDTNGNLYSSGGAGSPKANAQFLVNKSTDGGQSWSSPIRVNTPGNSGNGWGPQGDDKPSITADPNNPNYVYTTWARFNQATSFKGQIAGDDVRAVGRRRADVADRTVHPHGPTERLRLGTPDRGSAERHADRCVHGGQVREQPSGQADHAAFRRPRGDLVGTISALVQQPLVDVQVDPPNALVTDPDTGQAVEAHPMFPSIAVDRHSGKLYAVWIDGRFSNFQYNGIALSTSSDGGLTWSNPIQVNKTPDTVPAIDRQAFNPTVAVAADGTVAVTYYDFRNNSPSAGALTDYWMAFCQPSAKAPATNPANWSEVRLTNTSFDLEQAPGRFNGAFLAGRLRRARGRRQRLRGRLGHARR